MSTLPNPGFNLPSGIPSYQNEEMEQVCPNGHTWNTEMYFDMGAWFFVNEDDDMCPECGAITNDH